MKLIFIRREQRVVNNVIVYKKFTSSLILNLFLSITSQSVSLLVVTGGFSGNTPLNSAELYDPLTGTWTNTASLNSPRACHTASVLTDGTVLIAGGNNGIYVLTSAELYKPL